MFFKCQIKVFDNVVQTFYIFFFFMSSFVNFLKVGINIYNFRIVKFFFNFVNFASYILGLYPYNVHIYNYPDFIMNCGFYHFEIIFISGNIFCLKIFYPIFNSHCSLGMLTVFKVFLFLFVYFQYIWLLYLKYISCRQHIVKSCFIISF